MPILFSLLQLSSIFELLKSFNNILNSFRKFQNSVLKYKMNISTLSSSLPYASLDELLDSLGFHTWITVTSSFILPFMSFIGTMLCSLSAYIFFQRRFINPIFFYYRLLCIVYIIHLLHSIQFGLLFSPRYFPRLDTYLSSIYLIYYANISVILYHFEGLLQIAILLDRMKLFSSFVNCYFSASSSRVARLMFLACLFTGFSVPFSFKIKPFGIYFYKDSNGQKHEDTFYYYEASEFNLTFLLNLI